MSKIKLRVGDVAPVFDTFDVQGKCVRLSDYKKKKYTLLVFLRYSGCPWCNLSIHRLAMEYPMLKAEKCEVIAFIQSTSEQVHKNIYGRHKVKPKFSIIADPDKAFYKQYGVERSPRAAAAHGMRAIPQWVHAVKNLGFKQKEIDGDLFLVPAAFLISSRNQRIKKAEYGTSFYDYESFFKIYESLTFYDE